MLSKLHARWSNPRFFFAAEGGSTGNDTPPATLAEAITALTEARQTAKGANEARQAAETERDTAKSELAAAKTDATEARALTDSTLAELTTTKEQLTAANGQVTKLTGERDAKAEELTKAQADNTRIKKLCGAKGIDFNAAPPVIDEPQTGEKISEAAWAARVEAATDPAAKAKVLEAFKLAVAERRIVSPGTR